MPVGACALALASVGAGCSGRIVDGEARGAQASSGSRPGGADDPGDPPRGAGGDAADPGSPGDDGPSDPASPTEPSCDEIAVGATPLQRLGRTQYANSVRDLLQVSVDVGQLPEDEKFGAFNGNTVVQATDLVVEQYVSVAEAAARQALPQLPELVPCDRTALGDAACATRFIESFGRRAYRRPLQAEEVSAYETLFAAFADNGYQDALRVIVQTMLQSPTFLYRVELLPESAEEGTFVPLDAYELASRLSFFLLSTTPDDALLLAAEGGELDDADGLAQQVDRLLQDARFSDTLASFHLQWLELDRLGALTKDPELFPAFTPELASAMRDETLRFVDHVMRGDDATLETLLTAPFSFPQGPLLDVYGLPADAADDPAQPVALDPAQRAGLLTQPAFLAVHAHYNQSSPVQRGKVVIRNVLCQALPDPPPNVNAVPPDPSPDATTRERLLVHQSEASCANCHARIDGIGFGFEHFDAIGAYRDQESGKPIDASGEILGTQGSDGPFDGAVELARKLASSPEAQRCIATQWLRFALGRLEAPADRCSVERLNDALTASGGDLRGLLRAIAMSDAFRSKLVPQGSAP